MAGQVGVRIPEDIRDSLMQLKLRLSAAVGRNISMGATIGLMIKLSETRFKELAELAQKQL